MAFVFLMNFDIKQIWLYSTAMGFGLFLFTGILLWYYIAIIYNYFSSDADFDLSTIKPIMHNELNQVFDPTCEQKSLSLLFMPDDNLTK